MTNTLLLSTFLLLFGIARGQQDSCKYTQTFFKNGKVSEEGCLVNGQKQGLWKSYNETSNTVRFIWTYKNNLKDGPYKALGQTGIVEAIGKYSKGCLTDTLKYYNDEGQLTQYEIWRVDNYAMKKSSLVSKKILIKPKKPDGTVETINGTKYTWLGGRKFKLK